jgi:hypothetical protein
MMTVKENPIKEVLDKCNINPNSDKLHKYRIVRGSGKEQGIPSWVCEFCKKTVKSS